VEVGGQGADHPGGQGVVVGPVGPVRDLDQERGRPRGARAAQDLDVGDVGDGV
jgi:hypothetical protein